MFRYPGSKKKLCKFIIPKLQNILSQNTSIDTYIEPCFGTGAVGLEFLKNNQQIKNIWINDKNQALADLWTSIIYYPQALSVLIRHFTPSVSQYNKFKNILLKNESSGDIATRGLMKLALHQMSYSGLAEKSGGPIGGKNQTSNYKIDCRWSPKYLEKRILQINKLLKSFSIICSQCTSYSFESVLLCDYIKNVVFYLDPPYYHKGDELYECSFSKRDHEVLSQILEDTRHKWVLSYDDCPEIRKMYGWAKIEEISVNYTIKTSRKKQELLITKY